MLLKTVSVAPIELEITGPKENQSSHTNDTYKGFDAEPTSF